MNNKQTISQLKFELINYMNELSNKFIDSSFGDESIYLKLQEVKKIVRLVDQYEQ